MSQMRKKRRLYQMSSHELQQVIYYYCLYVFEDELHFKYLHMNFKLKFEGSVIIWI